MQLYGRWTTLFFLHLLHTLHNIRCKIEHFSYYQMKNIYKVLDEQRCNNLFLNIIE